MKKLILMAIILTAVLTSCATTNSLSGNISRLSDGVETISSILKDSPSTVPHLTPEEEAALKAQRAKESKRKYIENNILKTYPDYLYIGKYEDGKRVYVVNNFSIIYYDGDNFETFVYYRDGKTLVTNSNKNKISLLFNTYDYKLEILKNNKPTGQIYLHNQWVL